MTTEPFTTEEFTSEEKEKLAGIEPGANNYTHPATHPADMISDTAEKVVMTQQERDILTTLGMFTCNKVNDALDVINGESVPGGTPAKLDKVSDTKESIRQAINRMGRTVTPEEPFAGYAEKISDLPPVDDWQMNPTWWDIEAILAEDTRNYACKTIYLYANVDRFIRLEGSKAYATSDGAFYTEDCDHIWDTTKDKQCIENGIATYKTRYLIIYSDRPTIYYPIPSDNPNCGMLGAVMSQNTTETTRSSFFDQTNLQFVKLQGNIQTLQGSFFSNCVNLRSVTLPQSLTGFSGTSIFIGCRNLRSIRIPDTVTSLPASIFRECNNLEIITLPPHLTSIGEYAFDSCYSLRSIELPDTLTNIGYHAFGNCTTLKKISLPASITTLGNSIFDLCFSLQEVDLPDTLTMISNNMFSGCASMQKIKLPELINRIDDGAFRDTALTEFSIPSNVTAISATAFSRANAIRQLTIHNKTANSDNEEFVSFSSVSLSYISIPQDFDWSISIAFSNLSVENLIAIFNALKDNTGLKTRKFLIGNVNSKKLTDEQKAIATNKNWVLA